MLGLIITIAGVIAAYNLWGDHRWLSIIAIISTLYQASSLNEMVQENRGFQPEDKAQSIINIIASIIIFILLIYSFLV